jgi:hypothetical protein
MTIIRLANRDDAGQIQAIYAPIVCNMATSFELEAPSEEEMQQRLVETLVRFPWLVCEKNGEIQRRLQQPTSAPEAPRDIHSVQQTHEWDIALATGKTLLTI